MSVEIILIKTHSGRLNILDWRCSLNSFKADGAARVLECWDGIFTLCVLVCCAAWQQHDVQELCRVMFDALEQKWKQTEQVRATASAPVIH